MPSIDQFLNEHPNLGSKASDSASSHTIPLEVSVIGISDSNVEFSHLGKVFFVSRDDVSDITSTLQSGGITAVLRLKPNGRVYWNESMSTSEFISSIPFAFAKPSMPPRAPDMSPLLSDWISRTGYSPCKRDGSIVPLSAVPCESVSQQVFDDSMSDSYD